MIGALRVQGRRAGRVWRSARASGAWLAGIG